MCSLSTFCTCVALATFHLFTCIAFATSLLDLPTFITCVVFATLKLFTCVAFAPSLFALFQFSTCVAVATFHLFTCAASATSLFDLFNFSHVQPSQLRFSTFSPFHMCSLRNFALRPFQLLTCVAVATSTFSTFRLCSLCSFPPFHMCGLRNSFNRIPNSEAMCRDIAWTLSRKPSGTRPYGRRARFICISGEVVISYVFPAAVHAPSPEVSTKERQINDRKKVQSYSSEKASPGMAPTKDEAPRSSPWH